MNGEQARKVKVHIRWMIRRDMAEVLQIENESFEFPWSEEDFVHSLRQRNCIGMVATHQDRVIGFMVYELHKYRLHVLDFAVGGSFRRKSIGAQMVDKLDCKLTKQRRSRITLEVLDENLSGQLFFRDCGFKATQVLANFYGNDKDAYAMEYVLDGLQNEAPQFLGVPRITFTT